MKFKVDENLPREVDMILRDAGHDVMSVQEQGLAGKSDQFLAKVCAEEGRAIVTEDLDLADVRNFPPSRHAGIVVFRPSLQGRDAAMRSAEHLPRNFDVETIAGKLVIVETERIRVRQ